MSYDAEEEVIRSVADNWERALYSYLDSYGVSYLTEEQLKNKGYSNTPDALLLDEIVINNKIVKWIDCKVSQI